MTIDEGAAAGGGCNIGVGHADGETALAAVALDPSESPALAQEAVRARGFSTSELLDSGTLAVPDEEPYQPWSAGWVDMAVEEWGHIPAPFACSYRHDRRARRRAEAERFAETGGGPLGITGVAAIVLKSAEPGALLDRWTRLLQPGPRIVGRCLHLGDGPALDVREGASGGAITFGVRSLRGALAALAHAGVEAHPVPGTGEVRLDPAATAGLDIRLR
jgi:hypothetical protein